MKIATGTRKALARNKQQEGMYQIEGNSKLTAEISSHAHTHLSVDLEEDSSLVAVQINWETRVKNLDMAPIIDADDYLMIL